ncbi:thiolase family protein [Pseudomonas juntendi]|jgi:acetyl-CoA C-acetyltransferase|uniref:Thiolase family protein n=1 Tax=Pseudomonas juntendi TaxID=2666183 RepID=A0ABD4YDR3_9PSED|nr:MULTISPECIES: thiolase family protein [Pseudomonas]MBH3372229.1 thiolase family protein [Pseudomonas juntendi]MBS6036309.1 thiolase family protein [Pseudomonas sp.]MDG9873287.1 thiolase family protein [Pseudomonas juntendi]MDH0756965.1 thiolase family protein [Pseudomonas juntendi]MDH1919203.1 thiolase family protein [Pseudomonas juntendi]
MSGGLCTVFDDVAIVDMVRTPWVDLGGALATVSPIDLAIKAGRAVLARAGSDPQAVGSVLAGSMAQASFDAYFLPRHVGLYCGVPLAVPALAVQRICGTGLELLRQAAEQLRSGAPQVLCVGAESMSRNPIAAYEHRGGFRLGAPVGFKDFLWEALYDPAADVDMIGTADNLAREHGLARETVDAWALRSHQRALQAQQAGWFAEEIVSISSESFFADGYQPRGIELPRGLAEVSRDSHPRPTDAAALARLRTVHPGGVQTAGNSCAVADGAAAAVVAPYASCTRPPLAKLLMATAVGVSPHTMGIGPVPAIELLLRHSGLRADQIDRFEINEAQAAQVVAVAQALQLDVAKLNVHGGAIALGHPLAATGLRLVHTLARQLQQGHLRYGVAAACIGGGQGMALLIENPRFTA